MGSVDVVHGLCCPKACGILVPGGIKTVSPALPGRFLTTGAPSCYLYDGDDRNCLTEDHQLSEKWVAQCLGLGELVAQSRRTLCDPMDCSPPGSSAHGILQARIL